MNLTQIRDLIIRYRQLLIGAVLVIVGIVAINLWLNWTNTAFGKLDKPTFPKVITSKPYWSSYNAIVPQVKSAKVFKLVKRSFSENEATELASDFGFLSKPKQSQGKEGRVSYWNSSGKELTVFLDRGNVSFKDMNKLKEIFSAPSTAKLKTTELLAKAQEIVLKKKIVSKPMALGLGKTSFFNPTKDTLKYEGATSGEASATIMTIEYRRMLDKTPISSDQGEDLVTITLNKKGGLISLYYQSLNVEDVGAKYPLLNPEAARKAISESQAIVVRYTSGEEGYIETKPDVVYVGKGSLKYYNDRRGSTIQPIFAFEANIAKNNKKYPVEVFLSAIDPKWFK